VKKFLWLIGLMFILAILIKWKWRNDDYRLGIVAPDSVAILSISPGRGMINLLSVGGEVEMWLPGGMGWYQTNKIQKIFEMEKKPDLANKTFYYNFGFIPEKVVFLDDVTDWRNWSLIKTLGVIDWLRYKFGEGNWLSKSELVNRSLVAEKENFDEILPRDFSDNDLSNGGIKISVMNASGENGLGAFVADRLNWMGFNVVAVESEVNRNDCQIMTKAVPNNLTKKFADLLAKMFSCSQVSSGTLLPDEVVLYLGQNYAQMIKYSNYVRTF